MPEPLIISRLEAITGTVQLSRAQMVAEELLTYLRAGPDHTVRRYEVIMRVLSRVQITEDGCWEWQGPNSGSNGRGCGYPRMALDGQTVAVHRVVYTHFYGYIPGKKQIDHTCRNRCCVNPLHLEMVTHKENQKRRDLAK